jgi:hypothetical protein
MVYRIQDESDNENMEDHNDLENHNDEPEVEPVQQQPEEEPEESFEDLIERYGPENVNYVLVLPVYTNEEIEDSFQYVRNIANEYFSPDELSVVPLLYQVFDGLSMTELISQMFNLLRIIEASRLRIVVMYMIFYIINKTLPRYSLGSRANIFTSMRNKIEQLRNENAVDFGEFTIFGNIDLPSIETILDSWEQ